MSPPSCGIRASWPLETSQPRLASPTLPLTRRRSQARARQLGHPSAGASARPDPSPKISFMPTVEFGSVLPLGTSCPYFQVLLCPLGRQCWPPHDVIAQKTSVSVIACWGGTTGSRGGVACGCGYGPNGSTGAEPSPRSVGELAERLFPWASFCSGAASSASPRLRG